MDCIASRSDDKVLLILIPPPPQKAPSSSPSATRWIYARGISKWTTRGTRFVCYVSHILLFGDRVTRTRNQPKHTDQVTVENFLRVLTGRHARGTPLSRRLGSGPGSRVLVYMTGHGGDEFLKFHNHEEVGGADLVSRVLCLDEAWSADTDRRVF